MKEKPIAKHVTEFSGHLGVMDKKKKSKGIHFEPTKIPQFTSPDG